MHTDPVPMVRHGYRLTVARWNEVIRTLPADPSIEASSALNPKNSPNALIVIAAHEILEWIHSLHDFLRSRGVYASGLTPSEVDPDLGPYVDGLLGARIALHHQFTPVVGLVATVGSRYVASRDRWSFMDRASFHRR